jgi:hypothetical protein
MTNVLLILGILIIAFGPYLYFNKSANMNEKTYLVLLTLGSVLIEVALYMQEDKNAATYFLMGVTFILFLLAAWDAVKALSGKMTKYEKQRLDMLKHAEAVKHEDEARNKHFKM